MVRLTAEHRVTLARLEMVSNGCIYSYEPVASKGGYRASDPTTGDRFPPHLHWRREFLNAATPAALADALQAARDELEALTRRTRPVAAETVEQRDQRMIREGAGFDAIDVATRFRCGVREVHNVRRRAQRNIHTGHPEKTAVKAARADKQARALELRRAHPRMSLRQIAARVGCDHKTVAVYLEQQAA